jgi:hypothetical protein
MARKKRLTAVAKAALAEILADPPPPEWVGKDEVEEYIAQLRAICRIECAHELRRKWAPRLTVSQETNAAHKEVFGHGVPVTTLFMEPKGLIKVMDMMQDYAALDTIPPPPGAVI